MSAVSSGTFIPSPHGDGSLGHAEVTRMTADDAGVVQSFPRGYPWRGTKTKMGEQIGNAIPPLLARAVINSVRKG